MTDGRPVQFIVNPVSGGFGSKPLVRKLRRFLADAGQPTEVYETRGPGDAAATAEVLRASDCRAVVVVGGDGTVRETATAMGDTGVPLVVLPMGTENLVAKYFQMRRDPGQLASLLLHGKPVDVDIGEMRSGQGAGSVARRFLLVAGMGFDADVVRRLTARRKGHINHGDYFWPIWRSFWSYHHPRFRVDTEQGLLYEGHGLVFIGNIPRYAIGLRILPRAHPQDGKLDVCVFACRWQLPLLRHSVNTLLRRHVSTTGVTYRQAERVRVTADRQVPVQLDGDLADTLPAEFTLTGQKTRFLAPPHWRP